MIDPGVMGTLLIGLDRNDPDQDPERAYHARRQPTARPRRSWNVRSTAARGLRRMAAILQRPVVGEVAR